jgi:hypothetical protein
MQIKAGAATPAHDRYPIRERIMPITDIIILALIIFYFVAFAVVLAWGDHQTRDITKASRARALAGTRAPAPDRKPTPKSSLRLVEEEKKTPERTPVHA